MDLKLVFNIMRECANIMDIFYYIIIFLIEKYKDIVYN
jgi:hypothetical protein